MKQYQLVLVISMHVEKQCSSPLMHTLSGVLAISEVYLNLLCLMLGHIKVNEHFV